MECLIKKLFQSEQEQVEYEDPMLWDAHVDVIKRRMSKLRRGQGLSIPVLTEYPGSCQR